jgi:hypothetical protein
MLHRIGRHITYANVTATLALFIALGGSSYAVIKVGSKDIVNNSVRSSDIRNNSLRSSDIRNRTIRSQDIARDSLGGSVVAEGELGPVREARLLDGKSVFDLTVRCPPNTRPAGGVCIEPGLRPAVGYFTATNQCQQVHGSLPSLAELIASGVGGTPTAEWTSDLFQTPTPETRTLIVAEAGVQAEPIDGSATHPFRCTLPLSN